MYDLYWHRPPNIDLIRHNACRLAAASSKEDLLGILERMSPRLKEELRENQIEPLGYHFRKIAIKEFCSLQQEATEKSSISGGHGGAGFRPNFMLKNTVMLGRLQAAAEDDVDASVSAIIDLIRALPTPKKESVEGWDKDLSYLWGKN